MESEMLPPWLKYPEIPLGSAGWRMSPGEDYWYRFVDWFGCLSDGEKERYQLRYPKPESWVAFWPYIPDKLAAYFGKNA
ncbi:hypothetical protein FH712_10020 [Marinobacter nauticus]|uniref:hypothetical protein n=1 Tax=Marinobacter nauticus TaxID=2743 RepID=UPI00112F8083|nr:hypothetical protein [Marinobacter nauticus]TPW23423.1 hypothetical protein FH712_10020 [Marinobacter nauticus]